MEAEHPAVQAQASPQVAEWETTNLHQVASLLTATALEREESRGGHFREDFPVQVEDWRCRLVAALDPDGELQVAKVPVRAFRSAVVEHEAGQSRAQREHPAGQVG